MSILDKLKKPVRKMIEGVDDEVIIPAAAKKDLPYQKKGSSLPWQKKAAIGAPVAGAGLYGASKVLSGEEEASNVPLAARPLLEETATSPSTPGDSFAPPSASVERLPDVKAPSPIAIPKGVPEPVKTSELMGKESDGPKVEEYADDPEAFSSALADYRETINQANQAYLQARDVQDKRRLWEGVVNAVGKLAAGMYGLKSGLDLSGVEFNQSDWAEEARSAQQDLQTRMAQAGQEFDLQNKQIDYKSRRNQNLWERAARASEASERKQERAAAAVRDARDYTLRLQQAAGDAEKYNSSLQLEVDKFNAQNKARYQDLLREVAQATSQEQKEKAKEEVEKLKTAGKIQDDMFKLLQDAGKVEDEEREVIMNVAAQKAAQWQALTNMPLPDFYKEDDSWFGGDEKVLKEPSEISREMNAPVEEEEKGAYQSPPSPSDTIERKTADGKTALFDAKTKQFIRYKE